MVMLFLYVCIIIVLYYKLDIAFVASDLKNGIIAEVLLCRIPSKRAILSGRGGQRRRDSKW